ncbi:MAG: 30S ribosomal protein S5 [Nanoarchaeota archaeon]
MKKKRKNQRIEETGIRRIKEFDKEKWTPKTELGRKVKSGEIKTIDEILSKGLKILEAEITDILLPGLETDLISVGQSKGKFGGGKRSIWRQTQKKTQEGNKPKFSATAIVGNKNGLIGLGFGKSRETVPAREKAIRNAKLNLIKIKLGCGSWEGDPKGNNSIPFTVRGKCGSVEIKLMPAPRGASLVIEKECAKMLKLAGIQDIYSRTSRNTKTKLNLIRACFNALKQLSEIKV